MDFLPEYMIAGDELIALIKERLGAGQKVRYLPFRGVSMLPMLRQKKDSVELSPLPERLKPYDLPLYQRSDGQLVMHRCTNSFYRLYCRLWRPTRPLRIVVKKAKRLLRIFTAES